MTVRSATDRTRQWDIKKSGLVETLRDFEMRSPNMALRGVEDLGDEIRALVEFDTPTLIKPPGEEPMLAGPVLAGIRYHQQFLTVSPIPWEVVTVLAPLFVFHPSVNKGQGLCLGHPTAGLSMSFILHTTWAGLVFNTRIIRTVDWQIFNREAAAYVRSVGAERFPITQRGLFEPLTAEEAARRHPRFLPEKSK